MGTPAWAVHAIQAARSDAIRRSGAPVQVRCCGAAGVGLCATAPIATGEVILEERPLAAAPAVVLEDYGPGGGAGLRVCAHCLAPLPDPLGQLRGIAHAAGMMDEGVPTALPGRTAQPAPRRCGGCAEAVWCGADCERLGMAWHGQLCGGTLRQSGRPSAAAAAEEFHAAAAESGNAAFTIVARLYATILASSPDDQGQATASWPSEAMADTSWPTLRGWCGSHWWDTLSPAGAGSAKATTI